MVKVVKGYDGDGIDVEGEGEGASAVSELFTVSCRVDV